MAHKHPYKISALLIDPVLAFTLLRMRLAGWRPGQNRLGKITLPANVELFDEAKRVLENFGGLKIRLSDNCTLTLDPAEVCEEDSAEKIKQYAEICGDKLCPLGNINGQQDDCTLIIGESGRVYYLFADSLNLHALNFEQYIKAEFWFISNVSRVLSLKKLGLTDTKWKTDD